MAEKSEFHELKEAYAKLAKQYELPEFDFINRNFEIDAVYCEDKGLFLKRIRKQIVEKISSALRALEMFLNAQNAPMFIFSVIKSFTQNDKDMIKDLYNKLAEYEIAAFGLENEFILEKEIEFIKKACNDWSDIIKEMNKIYDSMRLGFKKESKKDNKSYLG